MERFSIEGREKPQCQACRGYEKSAPYPSPYPRIFTWISMDIHGYPQELLSWISMDIHGYPWISIWISMNHDENLPLIRPTAGLHVSLYM